MDVEKLRVFIGWEYHVEEIGALIKYFISRFISELLPADDVDLVGAKIRNFGKKL